MYGRSWQLTIFNSMPLLQQIRLPLTVSDFHSATGHGKPDGQTRPFRIKYSMTWSCLSIIEFTSHYFHAVLPRQFDEYI